MNDKVCTKTEDTPKKHGNLIYDTSPDLHRAIAWSDCYFGDLSSVVELFSATGKPVIIQSAMVEDSDDISITTLDTLFEVLR